MKAQETSTLDKEWGRNSLPYGRAQQYQIVSLGKTSIQVTSYKVGCIYMCRKTHTRAIQKHSMNQKHHIFEQDQGDWDGWGEER